MAGVSSGPTPWWQLPENRGRLDNLNANAPPGYTYDAVKMDYVPTYQSAPAKDSLYNSLTGLVDANGQGSSIPSFGGGPSTIGGGGSGVGVGGGGTGGGGTPATIPRIEKADPTAANAATFGAAKDQAGQTARASITGLRESLAGRGMLGSGAEEAGTRQAVLKAGQDVNDITRQNAVTDVGTNNEMAVANQSAGITQRGQDISADTAARAAQLAARGQDITQRGQDISLQIASMTKNQQILAGLLGSLTGTLY